MPLWELIPDWQGRVVSDLTEEEYKILRCHERTGRPSGSDDFVTRLEKLIARELSMKKTGQKKE